MGLWHAEAPDDPVRLTLGPHDIPEAGLQRGPARRSDHSPLLWPLTGVAPLIVGDTTRDLDDSFPADRAIARYGYRSALVLPLSPDARQVLWLTHHQPNTYTEAHARALRPVADLTTLAVEHDQLRRPADHPARGREAGCDRARPDRSRSRLKRHGLTRAKR